MRLFELSVPGTRDGAQTILEKSGWHLVGAGLFADVFAKQGVPYVLKMFNQDKPYIDFVELARRNPNPHFPNFRGLMTVVGNYKVVRMEKLTPLDRSSNDISLYMKKYVSTITTMPNSVYFSDQDERDMEKAENQEGYAKMLKMPLLIKALNLISTELLEKYHQDFHKGNVMLRGQCPVIIDPVH